MDKTTSRTERVAGGIFDPLDPHYETTISDGVNKRVSGGHTPEEAQRIASEKWDELEKED